jgi:hypothetical protein
VKYVESVELVLIAAVTTRPTDGIKTADAIADVVRQMAPSQGREP